jgi:transposase-like protein
MSHAVRIYYRLNLSFRDVEDVLAQRGITVSTKLDSASDITD